MSGIFYYLYTVWDYMIEMLPCAVLGAVLFFFLRPLRKKRLAAQGLQSGAKREGVLLFLTLFSAGLAALTLFPFNFWSTFLNGAHLPSFDIHFNGNFYWNVEVFKELTEGPYHLFLLLGNILMFAPFGFCLGLVGSAPRWWKALLMGLCISSCIEFIQLFIQRSSDINDIILNTFGALCGFWLYLLLKRCAHQLTNQFKLHKTEVPHGPQTRD